MTELAEDTRSRGHQARRQEIADAARALAQAEGWEAVTVRRIAARIGCSAPAIYQYFGDKGAILASIAAEGRDQLAADMLRAAADSGGPAKRLRAMAKAYWHFACTTPELYAVMHGLDDATRPSDGIPAAPEVLRKAAADLMDKKDIGGTADDVADQIAAVMHGFVSLSLGRRFPGGQDRAAQLMQDALDALLKGLGK